MQNVALVTLAGIFRSQGVRLYDLHSKAGCSPQRKRVAAVAASWRRGAVNKGARVWTASARHMHNDR